MSLFSVGVCCFYGGGILTFWGYVREVETFRCICDTSEDFLCPDTSDRFLRILRLT